MNRTERMSIIDPCFVCIVVNQEMKYDWNYYTYDGIIYWGRRL